MIRINNHSYIYAYENSEYLGPMAHRTQYPAALVSLNAASLVLDVAVAEAHKVVGRLGGDARVDFELDVSERYSCQTERENDE